MNKNIDGDSDSENSIKLNDRYILIFMATVHKMDNSNLWQGVKMDYPDNLNKFCATCMTHDLYFVQKGQISITLRIFSGL